MRHRWTTVVAVVVAGVVLVAGCGGSSKGSGTTTEPPSTTTTANATTTTAAGTTTTGGDTTTTSAGVADAVWQQTASQYRGQNGSKFTINCTPNGAPATIWGTETYTDDSSICTAAVHVGLITFASGGAVEYEIAAGLDEYEAGVANGVTSVYWPAYEGSFTFPAAPPGSGTFALSPASWERTATDYRGHNGDRHTIKCAPNGDLASIWGTGTYTDDSPICTAAVHAGLITQAAGGTVVITIAPGADSYTGSTANGVTSQSYPAFDGSYTFPADQKSA